MSYTFPRFSTAFSSRFLISSVLLTGCLSSVNLSAFAAQNAFTSNSNYGVSVSGMSGNGTTGYADAMFPLGGRNDDFFYIDPQIMFHNNDNYAGSLGLGKRWLPSQQTGILGAYVFADYNHAPISGHGFWFVSPGIERLGKTIDFSANLYVPVGSDRVYSGTYFANQLGIYDYVQFQGNSQFDQLFNTYESVGIGGDAEIGYRLSLPHNPKVYLGGYYFNPSQAQAIRGATLRLDVPLSNRLTLSLSDGYDNVANNTIKLGLTYNFAGRHNSLDFKGDLSDRMLDPVHRNLASTSGGAITNQPISSVYSATGVEAEEFSNITFFDINANVDGQDGTYEHPYVNFNQTNIDAANTLGNTMFYVNSGTYSSDVTLTLTNDSVWGRQDYEGNPFVHPGEGTNRPLFDFSNLPNNMAGFQVTGTTDMNFDSFRMLGSGGASWTPNTTGINVVNNSDSPVSVSMNNLDVAAFTYGANINNNSGLLENLTISNSDFHDNGEMGVNVSTPNDGVIDTVNVTDSTFNNNGFYGMLINGSYGVIKNVVIDNSTFNSNGGVVGWGEGLYITTQPGTIDNVYITNSTFNNNVADGFAVLSTGGSIGNIVINDSHFDANGNAGIYIENQNAMAASAMGNITINDSSMNDNGGTAFILTNNSGGGNGNSTIGEVTINDSTMDNNVTGMSVYNYGSTSYIYGITINNGSISNNIVGIDAYNEGRIGQNNEIILNNVRLSNDTTNATCKNATLRSPDGSAVYCP